MNWAQKGDLGRFASGYRNCCGAPGAVDLVRDGEYDCVYAFATAQLSASITKAT